MLAVMVSDDDQSCLNQDVRPNVGRCHEQIPAKQRENLLHSFWKLSNLNSLRQYILNHTAKSSAKSKLHGTKKVSQKYFFHVDGQLLQVCKTFFLDTLSVSDQTVRTTLQKLTGDGHLLPDQRRLPPLTSCKRRRGKRWEVIFGSFKQYRHIIAATHPQNSICQKLWPWPRCTDCT